MNEIDPLLRLSWFLAAAAPALPPAPESPALSAPPAAAAPVETADAAAYVERERRAHFERTFGTGDPTQTCPTNLSGIPLHPALTDEFFIGVGAGLYSSSTQARLNSNTGLGTNVDFEDALGLEETSWAPQALARWRFSDSWRLEFEYFQLNRSGRKQIDHDITWGDQTYPAGSGVSTDFDVSVLRVSCGYSFFKTQDKEVGVALGFHLTRFDAELEGSGGTREGGKLLAPLPVGSIYGQMALTDEWALAARLDAFRIEYDPYHGRILSIGVDALYQPWRHWGFGVGWRTLQVEGGASGSDWNGDISTTYTGPIIFVSTSF